MAENLFIRSIPWIIGTLITLLGLYYTAVTFYELRKPFEPAFSIGKWVTIGTVGMDKKDYPMIAMSLNIKNNGKKIGTVSNVALQVELESEYIDNTTERKKIKKSLILLPLRETTTIEIKNENGSLQQLQTVDVFHPFTIGPEAELRKIYAFVYLKDLPSILDKPTLNIAVWVQLNENKEWIGVANAEVFDGQNIWKLYKENNKKGFTTTLVESSKLEYEELIKKTNSIG